MLFNKYCELSSASKSGKDSFLNLERLSRSSRIAQAGISALNGFDSDAELLMYRT